MDRIPLRWIIVVGIGAYVLAGLVPLGFLTAYHAAGYVNPGVSEAQRALMAQTGWHTVALWAGSSLFYALGVAGFARGVQGSAALFMGLFLNALNGFLSAMSGPYDAAFAPDWRYLDLTVILTVTVLVALSRFTAPR